MFLPLRRYKKIIMHVPSEGISSSPEAAGQGDRDTSKLGATAEIIIKCDHREHLFLL